MTIRKKPRLIFAFLCMVLLSGMMPANAEIYKYKGADGKWKFTDKPPKSKHQVETLSYKSSKKKRVEKDLVKKLTEKFKPETVIEKTTLAVVSIETALGSGSGFFISDDGYIVTNKHVIRPTEFKEWKKSDKEYSDARAKIKDIEQELSERKARLKKMEQELSQYKRDIDRRYSDSERKVAYAEYDDYEARLNKMKSNYRDRKKWLGKKKRELSSRDSSFSARSASAKFARQFKVTLKGGVQVKAKLIKLSDKHDLALIKLDGHITPSIDITLAGRVRQGMKVFAIGSPLGLKDFVTSGIITSKRSDSIYTDTQILPGNSGGPLVNEQGHVLGVNTQKLMSTASIGSEGFGIAIPIKLVAKEFSGYLKKPASEKKSLPEKPS